MQPTRRKIAVAGGAIVLAVVVVGGLALRGSGGSPTRTASSPTSCNGAKDLCDRRLDEVVFPGTHNSFSASEQRGWYFANQRYGIQRQLDDGIRAFLIDVHPGVYDVATGRVRTDLRAEGSDRNKVAQAIPAVGLRLADRLAGRVGAGELKGSPQPYLCHTLCELGAEPLNQELEIIRRFLAAHSDQVLVAVVEDHVPPATIEHAFKQTGLLPYVATLDRDAPLPTLGALISRGQRLVVFAEDHGGSPAWYMPAFSFIQDTPLGARLPTQLKCSRFRGEANSPLLLINNWLVTFPPLPALQRVIGSVEALRQRIRDCTGERHVRGGIVAMDFYEATNEVKVAQQLNREPLATSQTR